MSREQCVQPGGDGGILALLTAAPARLLTLIDYCRLSLHDGDDLSRCATCL